MPDENRKPERPKTDPTEIEQLIEIELMQQRAAWQRAKARRGGLRALSILFLFVVIVGALFAYFVFLSPERINELKSSNAHPAQTTPSPTPSPQ